MIFMDGLIIRTGYRKQVEDVKQLKIRNDRGGMVSLNAIASCQDWVQAIL